MEKNRYDKVVFFYDQLAGFVLGKEYLRSKCAFLESIQPGELVLYIGGGSGENLALIQQRVGENGKVLFVEASQKMIEKAKRRQDHQYSNNVEFLHLSAFNQLPNCEFDFVITQYFLDILSDQEIDYLFEEVGKRAHVGSKWLLVDFFDRKRRRWLQFLMVMFFKLFTKNPRRDLPEYHRFFAMHGWELQEEKMFKRNWIKSIVFRKS